MGVSCSCPLAVYCGLENAIESAIVKSFSLEDDEQCISFKGKSLEPKVLKSLGSGKLSVEGSVKYRSRKTEMIISTKDSAEDNCMYQEKVIARCRSGSSMGRIPNSPSSNPSSPKHEAALKLQKVYKSFRTRRKLADCAVLIEQSWWKLLAFAELKRSSISFFDLEKHETAI